MGIVVYIVAYTEVFDEYDSNEYLEVFPSNLEAERYCREKHIPATAINRKVLRGQPTIIEDGNVRVLSKEEMNELHKDA